MIMTFYNFSLLETFLQEMKLLRVLIVFDGLIVVVAFLYRSRVVGKKREKKEGIPLEKKYEKIESFSRYVGKIVLGSRFI